MGENRKSKTHTHKYTPQPTPLLMVNMQEKIYLSHNSLAYADRLLLILRYYFIPSRGIRMGHGEREIKTW